MPDPLPSIAFSTLPYCHNMMWYAPTIDQMCYSGRFIVHVQEWGVYTINCDTGLFRMNSPVSKIEPEFQPGAHMIDGDCWQSGYHVAATPDSPKWIVITGTPTLCPDVDTGQPAGEIQVCKLNPGNLLFPLSYYGQIFAPKVNRNSGIIRIFGDTAYVRQRIIPTELWTQVDLNSLTVVAEDVSSPPAYTPQADIDGFAYDITPDGPSPMGSPTDFHATRTDQGPPGGGGGGGWPLIPLTVDVAPVPSSIESLTQTSGGHGYSTATATVHGGAGSGATINVSINAGVLTLTLGNHGTGYLSTPSVVITGDGSGAAATLHLPDPDQTVEWTVTNLDTGITLSLGVLDTPPYSMNWQTAQAGRFKVTAKLVRGTQTYTSSAFITVSEPSS